MRFRHIEQKKKNPPLIDDDFAKEARNSMYVIDLSGRVAIVTGARRGLGRQISIALAGAGADVVANSRKFEDGGEDLRETLEAQGGGSAIVVEGSVTESDTVERIVQKALEKFGKIDFLVNNAGIIQRNKFLDITDGEWNSIISVNLHGVFKCCQAIAKVMVKQHHGRIINIGSIAGKRGSAFYAHYAASKGALINLTKTMAKELGRYGILVNAIDPGRIMTDLLMKSFHTERKRWLNETPLHRLGSPQEVAGVVLFLVSELASYVTGETIEVNGGVLMD
jgi:3-oxoacyl-[acyl-carrier protein] reductase